MPETPTTPPAPDPKKTSRSNPGLINQEWLDELSTARQLVTSAAKTDYAALFAAGGIDAAKLDALTTEIRSAENLAGTAVQKTTGKQTVTKSETDLRDELIALIQEIQKRAKQKYAATSPLTLKDYAVGDNYSISRPILEQTAAGILGKLAADTLPGIDAAKKAALTAALTDYKQVQNTQTGAQTDATTDRANLEIAITAIAAKRREIQYAADAQWPHTNKANAGIRREFKLPPDRALK